MKAVFITSLLLAFTAFGEKAPRYTQAATGVLPGPLAAKAWCAATLNGLGITLNGQDFASICVFPGSSYGVCLSGSSCNAAYRIETFPGCGYTVTSYPGGRDATNGTACGIGIRVDSGATDVYLQVSAMGSNNVWTPPQIYCVRVCGQTLDCM